MNEPFISTKHITDIHEAFISANATFHFLLLKSKTKNRFQSRYLKMDDISSDWQVAFRNISKVTGGETMEGNAVQKFISKVIEKEDIYYRLTYSPRELDKFKRKLRLKTKNPGIDVFYNHLVDLKPVKVLAISDFLFVDPILSFSLQNYRMSLDKSRVGARVELKIRIVDEQGKDSSINKIIPLTKENTDVSLNLKLPQAGNYKLFMEVIDENTKAKTFLIKNIHCQLGVKERAYDQSELPNILKQTAKYCQKLGKAIFHFYCHEKVTERIEISLQHQDAQEGLKDFFEYDWANKDSRRYYVEKTRSRIRQRNYDPGKKIIKNSYVYDYQIIKESDHIREQRILINENNKKVRQKSPQLKTVLYSYKNTVIPIMLFSEKNQQKFSYRLLAKKREMGRKAHIISVSSRDGKRLATVWVDEEDFSILKFDVFPGAIRGYDKLLRLNKNKMSNIKIKDTHLFGHLRNGIRYPSKTEINVSFTTQPPDQSSRSTYLHATKTSIGKEILVKVNTSIQNKNFRFFDVSVGTKFKNLK